MHYYRSRHKSPVKVVPPPRKVFIEEMRDLGYKDAYRLDRKHDRDNYAYGSVNKKHLSRYKCLFKVTQYVSGLHLLMVTPDYDYT